MTVTKQRPLTLQYSTYHSVLQTTHVIFHSGRPRLTPTVPILIRDNKGAS